MPIGPVTFLDLMKMQTSPGYDLVEENIMNRPELSIFPADLMAGTALELTVRTDLPNVAFNLIGEGSAESKSAYITRMFQCANIDSLIKMPVNMQLGKPAELVARLMRSEQAGFVEAAMRTISRQTWYGVGNDAKGFVGLIAQMLTDANHVINAGGAENKKTSIYFVANGPSKLQYWFGNNRALVFDDWQRQTTKDANNLDIEADISWMHVTPAIRLENRNALLRIKNITTEATHTASWDLLYQALRTMRDDLGMEPTHIFMTGRSQEQLRQARVTDLIPDPPLPKDLEGIPFVTTSSISNAETI